MVGSKKPQACRTCDSDMRLRLLLFTGGRRLFMDGVEANFP